MTGRCLTFPLQNDDDNKSPAFKVKVYLLRELGTVRGAGVCFLRPDPGSRC